MARLTGIDKMSYADLLEAKAVIEEALVERKADEARETKAQLREVAEKAGFTIEELFGGARGRKVISNVKYRNPKAPIETWTGRGRKPNWLVEALKKGAKLESFSV